EAHIKSTPNSESFCEDLRDVLDELGEILDEEQAALDFELKPEITPPAPSICLDDDESLYTRRSNDDNDRSATNMGKSTSKNSKYCKADQKRRNRRSQSKQRNSPIRYRDRRSISLNSKYCSADRLIVRNQRSQSRLRYSPIRYRDRRSISEKRRRSKSSDRTKVRTRRRSSPRKRLERRPTSRCRSRSPRKMRRSDYIKNSHTLQKESSWAEGIQRRRKSSWSPKRSHDFRMISRYSPLRQPRRHSNSRKFSERSRSRSRSPRSKFPIRNICNNRSHLTKIAMRSRSGSPDRSRSRSVSSPAPFRKRSRSTDRSSNHINVARLGRRAPRLRIRHSSKRKSPSHRMSPLGETMTAVQVTISHQAGQPGEQRLKPMKIASPVNSSPKTIGPMITLHNNRMTRPTSVQRQLLPTPTAPHMLYTHFANIERLPYAPIPGNLAPIDMRHRLLTSRSLCYLGPNDLDDRIQNFYVQDTYLPPPAFNANAQWPSDYTIDYNSSGYY
ncbi:hypothetical protein KR032_000225, partial [Drosophila birchii]